MAAACDLSCTGPDCRGRRSAGPQCVVSALAGGTELLEVDGMAVTVELNGAEVDALQQILRRYGGGMDEFESSQLASIVAKIELAGNAGGTEQG
jgi:hypothetical protein